MSKAVPGDSRQDFRIMELDCTKAITYVQRSTECSQQPEEHAGGPKKEDEETTRTKNIFLSVCLFSKDKR